jgi:hypothetical protein
MFDPIVTLPTVDWLTSFRREQSRVAPQSGDISYLVVQPHGMLAPANPGTGREEILLMCAYKIRDIIEENRRTEAVGCERWWEILIFVKFT